MAKAQHTCTVCLGKKCRKRGALEILTALEAHLGVQAGETTPDGRIRLQTEDCLGECDAAPIVGFDKKVKDYQTAHKTLMRLLRWEEEDE